MFGKLNKYISTYQTDRSVEEEKEQEEMFDQNPKYNVSDRSINPNYNVSDRSVIEKEREEMFDQNPKYNVSDRSIIEKEREKMFDKTPNYNAMHLNDEREEKMEQGNFIEVVPERKGHRYIVQLELNGPSILKTNVIKILSDGKFYHIIGAGGIIVPIDRIRLLDYKDCVMDDEIHIKSTEPVVEIVNI